MSRAVTDAARRRARLTLAILLLAPAALPAQPAPVSSADSLAFPRRVAQWMITMRSDSLFAHASDQARARMQSVERLNAALAGIAGQFGDHQATDGERQFARDDRRVYLAASRFALLPEPAALVVVWVPGAGTFDRVSIMPLAQARETYPEATLP